MTGHGLPVRNSCRSQQMAIETANTYTCLPINIVALNTALKKVDLAGQWSILF